MTDTPTARTPRVLLWTGAALFWAVVSVLTLALGVALLDAVLVAVLLVAVPVLALVQLPQLDDVEIERIPAYWGSIVTLWLLGGLCWLVGSRTGGSAALGIVPLPPGRLVGATAAMTAAGMLVIVVFRRLATATGTPDAPLLRQLLPRTGRERAIFGLLSLAAGTGEEIAYRGYLIPLLAPSVGTGVAIAASSAVFGVAHAYQGSLGVLRTAVTGAVLAGGFLASGSLWPAILAHVAIDVLAGIVLGERLLSPEPGIGVDPSRPS